MRYARQSLITLLLVVPILAVAQDAGQPTNDAPNNYNTIKDYFKLPEGRTWGSTSAVDIDKDGTSIWVAERCGANSCLDRATGKMSEVPTVLKFDASGKLVKSFGAGLLIFPHGIHVDKDGNVWVTDGQDDAPVPARGAGRGAAPGAEGGRAAAPAGPIGPRPGATHGNQVFKFSPDGKVLLTLGKPGGAASPDYFYQPNDVVTAPNGDIFVSEGHGAGNNRVLKFDKTGKFIKEWGKLGTAPGEFDQPHALAFDSKGLLYVGDRNNNRIQVFDQNGTYIREYKQWSRPSGIFIKNDILYSADSESGSVSRNHYGWQRGLRWGAIKDGKIVGFIPDPETGTNKDTPPFGGTSAAEGVAVDKNGNIYGAEVGPKAVKKYVKK
ncbi:MAG TPA: peptidyl-alpha-hydroxyglycine alpha-amidating lyase family protein [Vicinamibacterales bacterium]|jgi:sugar lactone lactonase YvrE|nr:peptidyl-alpha-hydroxyglycine alpha-amidating lyase family protein [Vicinamibacterales bacterium]